MKQFSGSLYQFLRKSLVHLGSANAQAFAGVKFQNIEEQMFGTPFYMSAWFKAHRATKKTA
jgi:hypothetical protein